MAKRENILQRLFCKPLTDEQVVEFIDQHPWEAPEVVADLDQHFENGVKAGAAAIELQIEATSAARRLLSQFFTRDIPEYGINIRDSIGE